MCLLKVIMCVFNCIIFLLGGAAVLIGILVKLSSKYLRTILDKTEDVPPALGRVVSVGYLLIALGVVLIVIGFLGCCGALCENKCMLLAYFIIIFIIFIAEVAGAVLVLVFWSTAQKLLVEISGKVDQSIESSYGKNKVYTKTWNETMNLMKCCGYNNYTDFSGSLFVKNTSNYPDNCCHGKPCNLQAAESAHVQGCFDMLVKLMKDNSSLLAGVAICIAAMEVCAMTASIFLYKKK